jgi:hypothetical protein
MTIEIPVDNYGVGIIEKSSPAKDRDVYFPLKRTGKRLHTGTL